MQIPSFGIPFLNYNKVSLGEIPPEFLMTMSQVAFDSNNLDSQANTTPTPSEIHRLKRRGIAFLTNRVLNSPKGEVKNTITDRISVEHKYQQKLVEFTYGTKDSAK
jgi:hypothetical protein